MCLGLRCAIITNVSRNGKLQRLRSKDESQRQDGLQMTQSSTQDQQERKEKNKGGEREGKGGVEGPAGATSSLGIKGVVYFSFMVLGCDDLGGA